MDRIFEICCDASIKKFNQGTVNERTFGCAGAVLIPNPAFLQQPYEEGCMMVNSPIEMETFKIIPDTTNNRAELEAMYLAVKMAHDIKLKYGPYTNVIIYADSKFVVYGLKVWMRKWINNKDANGIMYNYNGEPVKNQELFLKILSYININKLFVTIYHQKGHVKLSRTKLDTANRVFQESNGFLLDNNSIFRISYFNGIIDNDTRCKLNNVNPNLYPINIRNDSLVNLAEYEIPRNYKKYIH